MYGGKPAQGSGTWGAFAKTWTAASKLFGNTAALSALKQGEEHGLSDYEAAVQSDDLPPECKALVRDTLMPQTREHLQVLDRAKEWQ